jgi:hypothetical protein
VQHDLVACTRRHDERLLQSVVTRLGDDHVGGTRRQAVEHGEALPIGRRTAAADAQHHAGQRLVVGPAQQLQHERPGGDALRGERVREHRSEDREHRRNEPHAERLRHVHRCTCPEGLLPRVHGVHGARRRE